MNWLYTFGKNMTVTDQHKKYWHITDYETEEAQRKGYVVDTLNALNPDASTFLKRNPEYNNGTIETALFNWWDGTVSIKRYEEVLKLEAPVMSKNGDTGVQYTLKIDNPNDAAAPTLAPTATFNSQNLGEVTYDIKPGEYILLDFTWNKAEDVPESITYSGYFSAFHCTDSDVARFTVTKDVTPKDLEVEATCSLSSSTGAFQSVHYKITNPNSYTILFTGTFKEDDTKLLENFEVGGDSYIEATLTQDGYKLTLDGTVTKKE